MDAAVVFEKCSKNVGNVSRWRARLSGEARQLRAVRSSVEIPEKQNTNWKVYGNVRQKEKMEKFVIKMAIGEDGTVQAKRCVCVCVCVCIQTARF